MGSQSRLQVGDKDKISELPDPVLSHILSFLATKYAVRTSVLCTRWKNIWASVPNLDFELKYGYGDEYMSEHARFLSFVDRVLHYRDSSDIQRFRLHCNLFPEDLSRIHGWVRTAIRRNVVELDLHVDCSERLAGRMFELPESVFICKTLVVLKLVSDCLGCSPPKSGCFPNLKFLHIGVCYRDNDMVEKLFSYFPLLEDLTIEGGMPYDISCNFKLSVPELKTLRINVDSVVNSEVPFECYFSINAPKLESLDLKFNILPSILFENAKTLVKTIVYFYYHRAFLHEDFRNRATTLLAAIANVKYLFLAAHFLDASCIPAFDNLIHLKLVLHDCYRWELLAELLKRSPNLECLVLEHKPDIYLDMYCYEGENWEDEESSEDEENSEDKPNSEEEANSEDVENSVNEETSEDEEYSAHPWWNGEEFAPICLLSHLKTISIKGFQGRQDEKEVAKYLLKNGEVLKKMTIYMGDFYFMHSKEEFYKEFALFQRGSRACRVKFI